MSDAVPATRILVVRADRIGDVILSTPVFEVLKRSYPESKLTVMVREAIAPLVKGLPSVDEVLIYDPDGRHKGIGGLFQLIAELREADFRIAVALQSQWKVAAALFAAGIRYRVGPISKLHSLLFYNRGVRQHRSQVEMHESDYNLQLLRRIGIRVGSRTVETRIQQDPVAVEKAQAWLAKRQDAGLVESRLILVHPGMSGSALNWPEHHYVELVRELVREGNRVLMTFGPTEQGLKLRFERELDELSGKVMFYGGNESGPIADLVGLCSQADLAIAPSTGPLHLAVALGKPVVTFYPPIRVQSALRWGPYVADEARASILVPEAYCGQDFTCLGNLCNFYPCMKRISVTQAMEQVHLQLGKLPG